MEAWSLHIVGSALLRTRKREESRPYLHEALRHFYLAGDAAGMTLLIDDLSAQALADEEPERAARLWGSGRALTKATGATLAAFTDTFYEASLRPNVRSVVAPADLERWAAEGAALSLDEAVAYALGIQVDDLATITAGHPD
jgi:hypothetical protein